jgi:hypothetical protein
MAGDAVEEEGMELDKSYSFVSEDGVHIRLEETPERESIVLSMMRAGKVETASLNYEQFKALMDLQYKLTVHRKKDTETGDSVDDLRRMESNPATK